MILLRTDPIIVGSFLSIGAVAQYGVALRVSENVFQLAKQYVNALSPSIAHLYGAKDDAGLSKLFVSSSRHATIAAGALIVGVVPWSDRLLLGWVGPKMLPAAPVMAILSLAMALCTVQMVVSNFLTFTDRHAKTVPFTTVSMLINVGASLFLVRRMGLSGVACGTLVSVVIVDVVYATWLGAKEFGVDWRSYVVQGPLRPAVCALAVTLGVWRLAPYLPPMNLPIAALASIVSIALYAALYFGVFSSADDKEKASWILTNRLRRLRDRRLTKESSTA
jgi:O-antigen/teichoic acid export membrane protein